MKNSSMAECEQMLSTNNPIVDEIAKFHFEGNIIPHTWFQNIVFNNDDKKSDTTKPDAIAIFLLAEIVYWYRPTTIRDENTGRIIEFKKRFKADLLQRNYESFANQFGFSKRQVRDAMTRLESIKVIKRYFRNIVVNGKKINNVLFIELKPKVLYLITYNTPYDVQTSHPITSKRNSLLHPNVTPYDVQTSHPITSKRNTNTENTVQRLHTEITDRDIEEKNKENSTSIFDELINLWNPDFKVLRDFVNSAMGVKELSDAEIRIILLEVNSRNEVALKNGRISDSRMFAKCVQWLKTGDMYKQIAESKYQPKTKKITTSKTTNNRNVNAGWSQDSSKYKPVPSNANEVNN